MKRTKKIYLTNEQLAKELLASQQLGHPTEKVCKYFRMIATHLLGSNRYRNYSKDMQDDLVSAALVKCVKNIHNFKPERSGSCFNYYTRCTEHAFWEVLSKYYKQKNIQRELTFAYANRLEDLDPQAAQYIRDKQMTLNKEDNNEQYD